MPYSIIDVAQCLAWIGASLRASSESSTLRYCVARPTAHRAAEKDRRSGQPAVLTISFDQVPLVAYESLPADGACWQNLVQNPVIARGFPVPRRKSAAEGLEASLDVMGALVDADFLTFFNGNAILKGFNAAVSLVGRSASFRLWHSTVGEFGARLPFCDPRLASDAIIPRSDISSLKGCRHILGWVSKVSYNIGRCILHTGCVSTWVPCANKTSQALRPQIIALGGPVRTPSGQAAHWTKSSSPAAQSFCPSGPRFL